MDSQIDGERERERERARQTDGQRDRGTDRQPGRQANRLLSLEAPLGLSNIAASLDGVMGSGFRDYRVTGFRV